MLSTGGNISDGAATPLEWSVWTAEKPADDIRDLGEHRMTSSLSNPRELTGAQAPPPSRHRGCLRYIAIDCIPDFAPPTTELSAGKTSPSALKCGAKFAALRHYRRLISMHYSRFTNLINFSDNFPLRDRLLFFYNNVEMLIFFILSIINLINFRSNSLIPFL